jgi:hypothetical protein
MRDGLTFASVLNAIAGIEETALDGNEGIVEITEVLSVVGFLPPSSFSGNSAKDVRFQEAIPMSVDYRNCIFIRNTDMVRLYPNQLSILLVCIIHSLISLSLSCLC